MAEPARACEVSDHQAVEAVQAAAGVTIRDLSRELYTVLYNDPYNRLNKYFPPWEDLPETARKWWDRQIVKIINGNNPSNKVDTMNGKKTYTVVLAGLAVIAGTFFQGTIDLQEAINQAIILLGIGGLRHGIGQS